MYHSIFQNKKNMHFISTMSNSHKKSWSVLVPKKRCFLCTNKSYLWRLRLTFLFIICCYFENDFYVRKTSKLFWSFWETFCLIFQPQDHFQNNNKNGGKNSASHKYKRHLFSYKTLKNLSKTWKKLNLLSDIHNLSDIYLSLTYFGDFEAYFCSIFHFY